MKNSDTQTTSKTFSSDIKGEEFQDTSKALPAAMVRQLSMLDPVQSTLSVLWNLGLIVAFVAQALIWRHPIGILFTIIGLAGCQQGLFVLAHEAAHYRLYNHRWLNDLVGRSCGVVIGVSMCTYRVLHRLHHNHLYGKMDPDIPLIGGYPRGKKYLLKKLGKDLIGLTAYKTYSYFFGAPGINTQTNQINRPLDDTSPRLQNDALQDRWVVIGFHIIAIIVTFAAGWGFEYLLLWILPLLTTFQFVLRLRAILEHGAVEDFSTPLRAARTNVVPLWIRWWLFPHHVNYHIEHHLYPSIPHYRLPDAHRQLTATGILKDAEVLPLTKSLEKIFAEPSTAMSA